MQACCCLTSCQAADELPSSDGDYSDVASADTDEGSVDAAEDSDVRSSAENNEDTEADEFVDAGDEVDNSADRAPWVTERRHSGDGEVQLYVSVYLSPLLVTNVYHLASCNTVVNT